MRPGHDPPESLNHVPIPHGLSSPLNRRGKSGECLRLFQRAFHGGSAADSSAGHAMPDIHDQSHATRDRLS